MSQISELLAYHNPRSRDIKRGSRPYEYGSTWDFPRSIRRCIMIWDIRYKNAIIHITGDPSRETLEETATRFSRKYTYRRRNYINKFRENYTEYYERKNWNDRGVSVEIHLRINAVTRNESSRQGCL